MSVPAERLYSGPEALALLPSVGVEVPLAEIYPEVPFPGDPGHSGAR